MQGGKEGMSSQENAPVVGFMTVSMPREKVELARHAHRRAVAALNGVDLNAVSSEDIVVDFNTLLSELLRMQAGGADCLLLLVGTWTNTTWVVTAFERARIPGAIWSVPDAATFSLTGAGIIHGSLDEIGLPHRFIYGSPDDETTMRNILVFARAAKAVTRMREAKCALIGGRVSGMYTTMPDFSQVRRVFGVEIEHVDQYRIILEAGSVPSAAVSESISKLRSVHKHIHATDDELERAVRLYHALKKVLNEDGYAAACVKCAGEVLDNYGSCCLPISLCNDEGYVVACEADVNAALTMHIMNLVTGQPSLFADVNHVDLEQNVLRLVNCGSMPMWYARSREDVDLGRQYEYMGKQRGVTTRFCVDQGELTAARLSRRMGQYRMVITAGEALYEEKSRFAEARDMWPQAFVRLQSDARRLVPHIYSNHFHATRGNIVSELQTYCELTGIEPITV
jgi:L-fucose isomerase